jgi:polygalacturonase
VNVAVTGSGTLDGGAGPDNWWRFTRPRADWERLLRMVADGVQVEERLFGFRPSFVQPYRCRGVRIEDVRIVNAPMWVVHPVLSSEVVVRGVTVDSRGPNNDGCNPDSCSGVLITRCSFDTGDDCIAIKSGRDADGRRVGVPCENVVIEDCTFGTGHGAVTIGSEMSGGVCNVLARGSRLRSGLDHVLRIKTNSHRGGIVENIRLLDAVVESVTGAAVLIDVRHADPEITGNHHPVVRDITVTGLQVGSALDLVELRDSPSSPITGVTVTDSVLL